MCRSRPFTYQKDKLVLSETNVSAGVRQRSDEAENFDVSENLTFRECDSAQTLYASIHIEYLRRDGVRG
jgi:hypothetical protein